MSKPLAAFYGYNNTNQPQQPKPQEYTVLGVNQPLIAPDQTSHAQPFPNHLTRMAADEVSWFP